MDIAATSKKCAPSSTNVSPRPKRKGTVNVHLQIFTETVQLLLS